MTRKQKKPVPRETVAREAKLGQSEARMEEELRPHVQDERTHDARVEPIERR
ncbi:MAG: hypothetical protein ISS78_11165 [Phycisphaerae bacterium]|nr:hypothetical protein [Phycisphaerae bacterium]